MFYFRVKWSWFQCYIVINQNKLNCFWFSKSIDSYIFFPKTFIFIDLDWVTMFIVNLLTFDLDDWSWIVDFFFWLEIMFFDSINMKMRGTSGLSLLIRPLQFQNFVRMHIEGRPKRFFYNKIVHFDFGIMNFLIISTLLI